MPDLAEFCTPIRSGLGQSTPAVPLNPVRARRLREDLAVLAAERRRALVASREWVITNG